MIVAAGSTATFHYHPDTEPDADPIVTGYDSEGVALTLDNVAVDVTEAGGDPHFIFTLEADETADLLGDCKLVWTWAWTDDDDKINTVRDVEPFTVVERVSSSVTLTVGTNSYVTLTEAEDYLNDRLGTDAWDEADSGNRGRALKSAARAIDSLTLRGRQVTEEQALEFPRAYWASSNKPRFTEEHERWSPSIVGAGFDYENDVPQRVKDAQCEEALALLAAQSSSIDRFTLRQQGVTSVRIGDFQESYGGPGSSAGIGVTPGKLRSVEALALMRPYIARVVPTR